MKHKFTAMGVSYEGATCIKPSFSRMGHAETCKEPWQGEYDSETGTITLTCKCGGAVKIETGMDMHEGAP